MRAGIALGSNIEPRLPNLQAAHRGLLQLHRGPEPVLCSKVYETSPVLCPEGSPPFLNAVLELTTDLAPRKLLGELQALEAVLGRPPHREQNSPRTIDLDLIYCGDMTLSDPDLILPHPRLAERRFVLQPLADIRPKLILPNFTKNVEELLNRCNSSETMVTTNFTIRCLVE